MTPYRRDEIEGAKQAYCEEMDRLVHLRTDIYQRELEAIKELELALFADDPETLRERCKWKERGDVL